MSRHRKMMPQISWEPPENWYTDHMEKDPGVENRRMTYKEENYDELYRQWDLWENEEKVETPHCGLVQVDYYKQDKDGKAGHNPGKNNY